MSTQESRRILIVITGPTAAGKTALAIKLAEHFNTEILSADSRQFYRELTIGTAKPSASELERVPHHFVDSHSVEEEYDAAQFGDDALKIIAEILAQRNVAIMCGGSGLYIKGVVEGFDEIPEIRAEIRENLVSQYREHGIGWLQEKMKREDPGYFATIDQQNPHRLIRALEVVEGTGHSISYFQKRKKREHDFLVIKIGLELPREELYQRIDERMEQMLQAGLVEEAKALYPFRDHNALQTVGYQEVFDHLDGKYDYDEMVWLLKRNTRRYAKRQLTWFKRDPDIKWFHPNDFDNIVKWIHDQIEKKL